MNNIKAVCHCLKKKTERMSTAQIIALGFAGVIFVGGLLLWLPFSAAQGKHTSFIDAMFTAATCVCVTGLVTVTTASHWSAFGKIIILILIQLGGMGVISLAMGGLLAARKRINTRGRRMIQEAYNLDNLGGSVRLLIKVIKSILIAETIGAVLLCIVFIPEFGLVRGLCQAVFTSISAFCNAGIDILGENSLMPYRGNVLLNLTVMGLIVTAGLGFSVWWDVGEKLKNVITRKMHWTRMWRTLHLQSKIVLTMTAVLVLGGGVLIFLFEYNNPDTIGREPLGTKLLASFFQSVTTRTAGFLTIDQAAMTDETTILSLLFMIIGGSPMGTAGGIKTTTFLVLILSALCTTRGKKDVEIFNRRVKESYLRSAVVVATTAMVILLLMVMLLCIVSDISLADAVYEITSAIGTVGLTRGVTSALNIPGKCIVIVTMYLGRIGPLTLGMAVMLKTMVQPEKTHLAEENIMIG